jgi:hypothetical protein
LSETGFFTARWTGLAQLRLFLGPDPAISARLVRVRDAAETPVSWSIRLTNPDGLSTIALFMIFADNADDNGQPSLWNALFPLLTGLNDDWRDP